MTNLCSHCHRAPRKPGQAYCAECYRTYQREWARRKRGQKARPIKPVCEPGEKFCTKCERILPIERFSHSKGKPDGLMSNCKECDYLKQLRWREKNHAYINQRDRLYQKQWRAAHPGYWKQYNMTRKRRRLEKKIQRVLRVCA